MAQNAYGALTGGRAGHVGGAEHQTSSLARWLASKGHRVSLITWDEGQPEDFVLDGVTVIKMCAPDAGLPGLRFFHPRISSLCAALRCANADVYYHNSAEHITGVIANWCRRHRRRFVYSIASNVACDPALPAMSRGYERALYRHGVRRADTLIVQSATQQKMLREGFRRDSTILPMPCAGPNQTEFERAPAPQPQSVAWVGRADSMKRLEWILEIAEQMPSTIFHLAVANRHRSSNAAELHRRAAELPNVVWRWNVERAAMPDIYQMASCLCCTSIYEGFPNTFLEAWSHGRPVITSFDPDGLVARLNLGTVASSVDEFVGAFAELFAQPTLWTEKARNSRHYYVEHHVPDRVMPLLERAILGPLATREASGLVLA